MANPAEAGAPDEAVGRRTFSTSFRGFDQGEVRAYLEVVAAEFTKLHQRIVDLETQLEHERRPPEEPVLDVPTLTRMLGEETARVLRTAQEAADDLRSRAEEGAARTLSEAHDEAARIRSAAEAVLAERTAEAEQAAVSIRRDAEETAARLVGEAKAEADGTINAAIERGRDMVGQAQAARERVLADLNKRRRSGLAHVDLLRQGRQRLEGALAGVRAELDRISADLEAADGEARTAVEAATPPPKRQRQTLQTPGEEVADPDSLPAPTGHGDLADGQPEVAAPAETASPTVEPVVGHERADVAASGTEEEAHGHETAAPGASTAATEEPAPLDQPAPAHVSEEPAQASPPAAVPADALRTGAADEPRPELVEPTPTDDDAPVRQAPGDETAEAEVADVEEEPVATSDGSGPVADAEAEVAPPLAAASTTEGEAAAAAEAVPAPTVAPPAVPATGVAVATEATEAGDAPSVSGDRTAPAEVVAAEQEPPAGVAAEEVGAAAEPTVPSPPGVSGHTTPRGGGRPPTTPRAPYPHDPVPAALLPSSAVGGAVEEGPPKKVDELFARIRADRAVATEEARAVLAPSSGDAAPPAKRRERSRPAEVPAVTQASTTAPPEVASPPSGPTKQAGRSPDPEEDGLEPLRTEAQESYLQRRDVLVEVVMATTVRGLRRCLADDQNAALDRFRTLRTERVSVEDLVGEEAAQVAAWARRAAGGLAEGAAAGATLAGGAGSRAPGAETVRPLADQLATELVEPLRQRLAAVLDAAGSDRSSETVDRINGVYREWRQKVERAVGDAVTAAVSAGFVASLPSATPVAWVVEDIDGPCPDCDDNALAGATPLGEPFPTGQLAPPAHPGCRCVLTTAST